MGLETDGKKGGEEVVGSVEGRGKVASLCSMDSGAPGLIARSVFPSVMPGIVSSLEAT